MKKTLILITSAFLSIAGFGQQTACRTDTVHFYQNNYRGKLSWQSATNGTDWTTLAGAKSDTLTIIASASAYFRTEIIEGNCRPYYSSPVHLAVFESPIVTLLEKDSVCSDEPTIILSGGIPSGGEYWGSGIIDGRFIPALAGAGKHQIFYRYGDPVTGCADTAFTFVNVTAAPNKASAGINFVNVPADSVLLDANIPENAIGTWSIVEGNYGHFANPHDPKSWFIKDSSNLEYTLRWTISSKCGTSHDDLTLTFFPLSRNPCPNAPTMTDADGNVYPTVLIGTQCWMAKNINVGRFVQSSITNTDHSNLSNNGIIEKYCLFNNLDSCKLYGGLYDWDEAMGYTTTEGARGICPEGWHLPTVAEWNALDSRYKWGEAGRAIKIGGSSGFDGHFAGDRHAQGEFFSNGSSGFFWVSGSYVYDTIDDGFMREIAECNEIITYNHFNKKTGLSVRCIKNSN
jgi:uncharacterized protein (TIGR02145 family)